MYNHHEICKKKNYHAEVSDFEKDHLCIEIRCQTLCTLVHFVHFVLGSVDRQVLYFFWVTSYTILRLRPNIYFRPTQISHFVRV